MTLREKDKTRKTRKTKTRLSDNVKETAEIMMRQLNKIAQHRVRRRGFVKVGNEQPVEKKMKMMKKMMKK